MLLAGVWEENYNSTNNWRECAGLSRINDREFYDGLVFFFVVFSIIENRHAYIRL